ncbi:thiamine pyrophosphate-binding protein [Agrobacterium sp. LAD9]|uniref:thiamine pyrophosphate-binding protein n=1 Tax=Agrobacterium sp. LAD9 TaxID=2055153 RepID=UPI00211251E1|nr:thiamine pyrophosphate-binding protein [Agrobacterium sp. LAD9]
MRCVLNLQENIVTGMADRCFCNAHKPAFTLLHCGTGLANCLANLHNARRASSGVVDIVDDQATYRRPLDAPLTAPTEALARTVWHQVCTSVSFQDLSGRNAAAAIEASRTLPSQMATLILPSDVSWNDGGVVAVRSITPAPSLTTVSFQTKSGSTE